jgi:hypothetical protein
MSDGDAGDFLARLTAKLAAAGITHLVVGSFARSFHGVPRGSQDLDLVIDPDEASLHRLPYARREAKSHASASC